jgi:hypothetical protein
VPEELQTAAPYSIAGAIMFAAWRLTPTLRKLIPLIAQLVQVLVALWEQREVKLEQEDRRDRKRRRAESGQPLSRTPSKMPSVDAAPEHAIDDERTDVISIREVVRKRSPGLRKPTRGDHHDGEE